ncbi:MAG: hypothetical protein ABW022_02205, partial [Actinoplanes sp.]
YPDNAEELEQSVIYVGFGAVMHQFQVIELTLWQFLTRTIDDGPAAEQAIATVENWDAAAFGDMVRGLKTQPHWPTGLVDELEGAVATRNYLTHNFLREHFAVTRSEGARSAAARELADLSKRLLALEDNLEAHLKGLGIAIIDTVPGEITEEIEALRPKTWLTPRSHV